MTLSAGMALLASMVVLALLPSVSVLAVSARAASAGFVHGAATSVGIIVGDIVYILLALFGLALLTEAMGEWSYLVKYVGGAYLIWMGLRLWKSGGDRISAEGQGQSSSLLSSFLSGLLLTLADQKALIFYLGFLPAFIDLSGISYLDAAVIMAITVVSVGGVKLSYAFLAHRAGKMLGDKANRLMN